VYQRFTIKENIVRVTNGLIGILVMMVTACTTDVGTTVAVLNHGDAVTNQHKSNWDRSYGGVDKSYDTVLLKLRDLRTSSMTIGKFLMSWT
jgi:hypothetical protein